jgi:predicted dehydrogenase
VQREKIKFIIVGCGHIGKRHARIIRENADAELVALVDCKAKELLSLEDFSAPFFSSMESFCKEDIPYDVAIIATPNGFHTQQALFFLNQQKHVVVEKPLALTATDALSVNRLAGEIGKKVFTVMQNRYSPPVAWLKDLIDKKLLGSLFLLQLNCYWNRDERYYTPGSWHGTKTLDGGVLFTQFSHFIDIMYWLFGDIKNIKGHFYNFNHGRSTEFDDSGNVMFQLESGGMGSLHFSTSVWDKNMESSITILAENGTVRIGGQYMNKLEYCHIKACEPPVFESIVKENNYGTYQGSAANHSFVLQHVIDVLQGVAPASGREDGYKVVDIIERIYKAKNN